MPDPTLTKSRTAAKSEPALPPVSPLETGGRPTRRKLMAIAFITIGCLVLAGGYFVVAARRGTAEAGAPGADGGSFDPSQGPAEEGTVEGEFREV